MPQMYWVPGLTGQVAPASRKLQAFSYPAGIERGKGIPVERKEICLLVSALPNIISN
jgi:hypothetical protein